MKEENKNNGRGIFYGVIGVATLVVAIIGATFAYFTASQNAGQNVINGNMASINFGLQVEKVVDPGSTKGIIPMSNTMVEKAVNNASNDTCVDDNGNAVCQIYKITVTNSSTAAMFVDGYVALAGGSGLVTDYTYSTNPATTMRWAQVFKQGEGADNASEFSTAGVQKLGVGQDGGDAEMSYGTLDAPNASNPAGTTGMNRDNILKTDSEITGSTTISGNSYKVVKTNFIRVSDHAAASEGTGPAITFDRSRDLTSMLVLSQQLQPAGASNDKDKAVYYFVVWLSETGNNQTAEATPTSSATANPAKDNFFNGVVTFVSAQGSEVTATFSGYTAVISDQAVTTTATP